MGRPDANSGRPQTGGRQHQPPQEYHELETIDDDDEPPPFETSTLDENLQENHENLKPPKKEEIPGRAAQIISHPITPKKPMAFPHAQNINAQMRSTPTASQILEAANFPLPTHQDHEPQPFPPPDHDQEKPHPFPPPHDHHDQDEKPQTFSPPQGHYQPQPFPPPPNQDAHETPQPFPPPQDHTPVQPFPPPQDHTIPQPFPPPQKHDHTPQPFPPPQPMPNSPLTHDPHAAQVVDNNHIINTGFPVAQVLPTQPWKTDLFGCMDDPTNALVTACFPCVTFGQIAEIVDSGHTSCGSSGMLYGVIACFTAMPCLLSYTYRTKLRSSYGLIESPAPDCLIHCFCECCALCQEYRELQKRNVDPSIGWQGNLARNQQMVQLAAMTPPMNQTMEG